MIKFKHFIITQFNLRLWNKDKLNRPTYTDEWLEKRFILFEKNCLPSFINQINKNFIWICLFDERTPEKYLDKIDTYKKEMPQLQTYFLNKEETADWLGYTKNRIGTFLSEEDEYIVTTNVDNDDAIHCSMIQKIRDMINENPQEILYSFNLGYQYFSKPGVILKMKYPHNHFLTLTEKNTPAFNTIKACGHAKARKIYKTLDIKGEPYWIEFVHDNNVNNDLRITSRIKYYPVFRTISLDDFGIDLSIKWYGSTIRTITKMPFLFTRIATRRLRKKIGKR